MDFIFLDVIADDRFQDPHSTGHGLWFDESRICRSRPPQRYIPNNYRDAKIRGTGIYLMYDFYVLCKKMHSNSDVALLLVGLSDLEGLSLSGNNEW